MSEVKRPLVATRSFGSRLFNDESRVIEVAAASAYEGWASTSLLLKQMFG